MGSCVAKYNPMSLAKPMVECFIDLTPCATSSCVDKDRHVL